MRPHATCDVHATTTLGVAPFRCGRPRGGGGGRPVGEGVPGVESDERGAGLDRRQFATMHPLAE